METTGAIEVDVNGFRRQTVRILAEYGHDVGRFMEQLHTTWCKGLAKNFPPSKNMFSRVQWARLAQDMGASSEQRLGKNRVKKDILKVFQPLGPSVVKWQNEDRDAWIFKTRMGAVYGIDRDMYRPNASNSELSRQHERYRGKNGRVTEARYGGRISAINKPIGRWKFVDVMHVNRGRLNSFIRHKQKSVGKLKGGWVAGITHFGGKAPARWITRHAGGGTAWGRIDDTGSGALHTDNGIKYASSYARILRYTARMMEKHMQSKLTALMRKDSAKWSAMRTA